MDVAVDEGLGLGPAELPIRSHGGIQHLTRQRRRQLPCIRAQLHFLGVDRRTQPGKAGRCGDVRVPLYHPARSGA
jgi:hypothetical protein